MTAISAHRICVQYQQTQVLKQLDVTLPEGKVTALLGANGCGKSTLLKALSGQQTITEGEIRLGQDPLGELSRKAIARKLAFLPQHPQAPDTMTVAELVMLGRYPYRRFLAISSAEDHRIVQDALVKTGLETLADRHLNRLSGGQRQRAWLAMVLAQQAPIMMLDEPTSFLDIAHQYELLSLVRQLNREQGTTVVMVLHDISQAIYFSDHILLMKQGQILAQGTPGEVINEDSIQQVFGFNCRLEQSGLTQILVPEGY